MKKKLLLVIVMILTVVAVVFVACKTATKEYNVSVDQAKEIALSHLGITNDVVTTENISTDSKATGDYYRVEFTSENVNYMCRVDADSGEVLKVTINDQEINKDEVPASPFTSTSTYINKETAKNIAFTHVGCLESEVTKLKVEFDFDDGSYLYEIEFVFDDKEYEYELFATNGDIYKIEVDNLNKVTPIPKDTSISYITVEQAKEVALFDSGVEENATFLKVSFDKDKGVHIFEIEFMANGTKYEYEINAVTGAIIEKEIENSNTQIDSDELLGAQAVLEKAITHAGISLADVIENEVKLEIERGIYVYEVEFETSTYEFEYKINAKTGEIISVEKELRD